jgi:hypothetical protein
LVATQTKFTIKLTIFTLYINIVQNYINIKVVLDCGSS